MKANILFSLIMVGLLLTMSAAAAVAAGNAAFTTLNPHVDDVSLDDCKNSAGVCNSFEAKDHVWLNGGLIGEILGTDGAYFFSVLVPGGQSDPNDGGEKNLSDDFDDYTNRTFIVSNGEVSSYEGTHWLDSGKDEIGPGESVPNGILPYIRLFPYAGTWNPGGVYILAVCSLEDGYPVSQRNCKFEAFKVKEAVQGNTFYLQGMVFEDMFADGVRDAIDAGLKGWKLTISGSGPDGKSIEAKVSSDKDGYWEYQSSDFSSADGQTPADFNLAICQETQSDATQSYPTGDGCHHVSFSVLGSEPILDLDFGNWYPVEVTACVEKSKGGTKEIETNWLISLSQDGEIIDTQPPEKNDCYTWTGLPAGFTYGVHLESTAEENPKSSQDWIFPRAKSGDTLKTTFDSAMDGCTPGFWQGGNANETAGGKWLWNQEQDMEWVFSGGIGWNPFIWSTPFNSYFEPYAGLDGMDMITLVDQGGGLNDYQKAARELVAAYLNASWGMNFPFSTEQLSAMWSEAVTTGEFMSLHSELNDANNARLSGGSGKCPIDARFAREYYLTFLPILFSSDN